MNNNEFDIILKILEESRMWPNEVLERCSPLFLICRAKYLRCIGVFQ